ncbi:Ig-like domain-containing protein [Clostridium sp. YIM B02569]|uniref:Ig-like domain-containing protein n=1 Tax=Clostridium sp. YIM B02569 TaxID=2911967 RepID=UPI001EED34A7|nr:Ig-like domain-containing protein [Clostridium sp. YIM B02569]
MKNYFKKFSIMFVMLLAVLGIGTIQNGDVANAATIGQQLTSPEEGWQRIDDEDARLHYTLPTRQQYSGSYSGTLSYTNNGTLTFKFKGSKLMIGTLKHYGHIGYKVNIDGIKYPDVSTYSPNIQYQIITFAKLDLANDIHTVTISNMNTGFFALDFIDIDNTGYLVNPDESISLDKSSMDLTLGDTKQVTATTTPASVQVNWSSSDESVATVDSTGKVTALKEGQATITATTADGVTATCAVTVTTKTAEPTNPDPDPTDSDKIVNIAHAKGDNTNNAGGDVTIIFHGAADTTLSVIKTADVKDVWVGDNFTYTIVVTNTGTKTAKAVVVNDPAPNHIDFVVNGITTTQGTVDPSSTSKNIIVNVGDIAPGATVTIKIPATVVL